MATSNQWWTEMSNKCVCWPVPSFIHQIKTRLDQHFSSFRAQMERNQLRPHLQFKSSSSLGKSSDQYELKQFKWIDSIEFSKTEKKRKTEQKRVTGGCKWPTRRHGRWPMRLFVNAKCKRQEHLPPGSRLRLTLTASKHLIDCSTSI